MTPPNLPADAGTAPAILLAAGASTRLGRPKQLLRLPAFGGETLLGRAARLASEAGAAPVYIVLGAFHQEIRNQADLGACRVLINPDWVEGMASSLRLGIHTVRQESPTASGALLMVCDQPALTAEHLRAMLARHRAHPLPIIASAYAGRVGVPVLTPAAQFNNLLALQGDQGARAILRTGNAMVEEIPLARGEWDIDTLDDLAR